MLEYVNTYAVAPAASHSWLRITNVSANNTYICISVPVRTGRLVGSYS